MPTHERRRKTQLKAADDRVTRLRLHEIIAVGECASGHPGGATSERSAICEFGQRGASFIQTYMSISTALAAFGRDQTAHANGPATYETLPARLIGRAVHYLVWLVSRPWFSRRSFVAREPFGALCHSQSVHMLRRCVTSHGEPSCGSGSAALSAYSLFS
jgi:hypothetical protein